MNVPLPYYTVPLTTSPKCTTICLYRLGGVWSLPIPECWPALCRIV